MSSRVHRYSMPCVEEIMPETGTGFIYEYCNSCKGERKHVRHCNIYEKCTRVKVGPIYKSCDTCNEYKPQQPEPIPKKSKDRSNLMNVRDVRKQALEQRMKEQRERANEKMKKLQQGMFQPRKHVKNQEKINATHQQQSNIEWSYGVTTVPERKDKELSATLLSLRKCGFDDPILFVDGGTDNKQYENDFGLKTVVRSERIGLAGNWILSMYELVLRYPKATRYVIFQDDIQCVANLKKYLEHCDLPSNGYYNLITYPQNDNLRKAYLNENEAGWYPSNQAGKGAQALLFGREAAVNLLTNKNIVTRYESPKGTKNMDGGIIHVMRNTGFTEFVHYPSLVNHTGIESTVGNAVQPTINSFPGETFDIMKVIEKKNEPENDKGIEIEQAPESADMVINNKEEE